MATTSDYAAGNSWTGTHATLGMSATARARNFVKARRHTRIVRALRWSLPGMAGGIVVLYAVMVLDTTGMVGGMPHIELPRIVPDHLTMDNPRYEGFNKDGGKYVVVAKTAIQDLVNTDRVRLNGINGDMVDAKKSKTNLKAVQGDFNTKTNELELSGGIDIVAESGLKAKLTSATILTKDNVISSKEPVFVEMPSGTIRSNTMRLLNKSREIAFVGDVVANLVPPKDDTKKPEAPASKSAAPLISGNGGPIDITANRLDIDDTGKTATFTGTVKAIQGEAALETAGLKVFYEGGNAADAGLPGAGSKIKRIVSETPVVMTRAPQDRVTGNKLDYDAANELAVIDGDVKMASGADRSAVADKASVDQKSDVIVLTGNVVTKQGRNILRGERLFVERASGRTQLTSPTGDDEHGRISARFYRGDQNAAQSLKEKAKATAQQAAGAILGGPAVFKTDPTAPIDIDAARLDVDDRSKQAIFKGDVRVVQGDFVVRTSELRAFYNGSAGLAEPQGSAEQKQAAQISKIEARGKVIVTSKNGQNATGDWANFDVKNNKVVLGGDVILTQGKNVVRGTELTIDMVTGESIIDNGKDGNNDGAWSATASSNDKKGQNFTNRPGSGSRPSAIFYPQDKKPAEKKPTPPANQPQASPGGGWSSDPAP
jgi:lipopolysaccharide transport protein LptA